MHRESVFVCSYHDGSNELVARVRAWDDKEAAELFAHELELEWDGGRVPVVEVRVRSSRPRKAAVSRGT